MPDSLDGPVAKALRAHDEVSTRDLIRSAQALVAKYHHDAAGMFRFAGVFRSYRSSVRNAGTWLARLRKALERASANRSGA